MSKRQIAGRTRAAVAAGTATVMLLVGPVSALATQPCTKDMRWRGDDHYNKTIKIKVRNRSSSPYWFVDYDGKRDKYLSKSFVQVMSAKENNDATAKELTFELTETDKDLSISCTTTYSARKYAVGAVIGNGSNKKQIRLDDYRCETPKRYVVKCEREYIDAQSSLLVYFTVQDGIALTTEPK